MKKLFILLLAVCLAALPCQALIKQVTSVGASPSTIFMPGQNCLWVTIQNNGSGNVRLSLDGSAQPTATTGYLLVAGAQVTIAYGGSGQKPIIRAILTSVTATTLDITTSDTGSQ